MRRRHSTGSLRKQNGKWLGSWYSRGKRKSKSLGSAHELSKSQASELLSDLIRTSKKDLDPTKFGPFVTGPYFEFFSRKWKGSTRSKTVNRVSVHLVREFSERDLASFKRNELQDYLDAKAKSLSYSMVNHLRWDLKQIFDLAVAEGLLPINPALMLFTPRDAKTGSKRVLALPDLIALLECLSTRERLIAKMAILAGMRPGEIFALRWDHVRETFVEVQQRVYEGVLDSPKSGRSFRHVAIPDGLMRELKAWQSAFAYVFPSERMTPLGKNNVWRRNMLPRLKKIGLEWASFQVMRRTFTTLCKANGGDAKTIADQCGHDVGVSLREYVQTPIEGKLALVNSLEKLLN